LTRERTNWTHIERREGERKREDKERGEKTRREGETESKRKDKERGEREDH